MSDKYSSALVSAAACEAAKDLDGAISELERAQRVCPNDDDERIALKNWIQRLRNEKTGKQ